MPPLVPPVRAGGRLRPRHARHTAFFTPRLRAAFAPPLALRP